MQPLTAPPRDGYTAAQMTALLVAPDFDVDYGIDLLNPDLSLVETISKDVASAPVINRDNYANAHGSVNFTISRELAWGFDRVMPFMLLSSLTCGLSNVRWNQGVHVVTSPGDLVLGESPQSWSVTGYDQVYLLQNGIGDSYSVAAGANVLAAVRAAITAAGVIAPVLLDSTASTKTLASTKTWLQTSSSSPSWREVINDLLDAIGYRGIWADWDGNMRSGPYVDPAQRPSEFTFDVGHLTLGVVGGRKVSSDLWSAQNWWRFVQNGLSVPPAEGAGQYTRQNDTLGPSSTAAVQRLVKGLSPVTYLDAVDQASLVVQGDKIVTAALKTNEVITASLSPFPALGHFDVVTYSDKDLGADRLAQCRSWSMPLNGDDSSMILETVQR